ncbi:MAG: hypothetical protein WCO42_08025 [bacterium]
MNPRPVLILPLLFIASVSNAIEFRETATFDLPANRVLTNELWMQARLVTLAGTANDDCFILADSIGQNSLTNPPTLRLSGVFRADIWGCGETVEMTGTVSNNARLAAMKTLSINGPIGHNLMAAAPTLSLGEKAMVQGSALLVGQDIILNGSINGDSHVYGNKVTLAGQFNGNLAITATDIIVMPGTRIAGNLSYRMDRDLILDSRVALGGKMIKEDPLPVVRTPASTSFMLQLTLLCGAIMVGMAFVSLMPGITALSVHKLSESVWRCLLFGFITFALVPLLSIFLIFTVAGIPLAAILMLAWVILLYVSKIIVGLFVGHVIIRRNSPVPANLLFPVMALGLLTLYAATSLPFPFDFVFWFAITLSGMGALAGAILDRRIPVMVACPPDGTAKPPSLPGMTPPGAV